MHSYFITYSYIELQNARKVLTESGANVAQKMDYQDEKEQTVDSGSIDPKELAKNELSAAQKREQTPFDPSIEPLLKENPRRFVIFPIQYHDIWQMYKKVSVPPSFFH